MNRVAEDQYLHAIVALLSHRIGVGSAVTIDYIATHCQLPSRRATEQILENRLADIPFPIVSDPSAGIFIPETAAELNHYDNQLFSRMRCMGRRRAIVAAKAKERGFRFENGRWVGQPRQMDLALT